MVVLLKLANQSDFQISRFDLDWFVYPGMDMHNWLVVWNMAFSFPYIENDNPN